MILNSISCRHVMLFAGSMNAEFRLAHRPAHLISVVVTVFSDLNLSEGVAK